MYLDAKIKQRKNRNYIHISGSFLILGRPEDSQANSNDIRAMVRHVAMKSNGKIFVGVVRIGFHSISLVSTYGGDGCAIKLPDKVYESGFPLPEILYKLYSSVSYRTVVEEEEKEFRNWGRALLRHQQRRLKKGCYRCHNKEADTELLIPCKECVEELEAFVSTIPSLPEEKEEDQMSIPSQEKVGVPTVGVQP